MSQQPSGWYDDPSNPDLLRYWDGVTWTEHTAPRRSPTVPQPIVGQVPSAPVIPRSAAAQQPPTAPMAQGGGAWQAAPSYPTAPSDANWMHALATTRDGVPLASWGQRFAAWLLDGVILSVLSWVGILIFVPSFMDAFTHAIDVASTGDQAATQAAIDDLLGPAARASILGFVIVAAYCIGFWTTIAQTPGKMALGISVRRVDRPGPIDLVTALKRRLISVVQLIPGISGLYGILGLLDGLWPLWDGKRQTLHDKIAGTQVVRGKQPRKQR